MNKLIHKAVFPVAGLGTRFMPATKASPKEMLPVVDKPLIQYAAEDAIAADISNLIFINGKNKRAIEDHFDNAPELEQFLIDKAKHKLIKEVRSVIPPDVHCINVRQRQPKGLGAAVLCAEPTINDEAFAVILADDLIINDGDNAVKQLLNYYSRYQGNLIMVEEIPTPQLSLYGIIEGEQIDDRVWKVNRVIEKPRPEDAPSNLGVIGRYILNPSIFQYIRQTSAGAGGEIQLTDAIALQMKDEPLHAIVCEGTHYDCGNKLGYLKANVAVALAHKEIKDDFKRYLISLVGSEDFLTR